MHSGLPSLLDAIFGKKDLASVSVNELEEVLNEFPSFNVAHFFLSKKLKDENGASFEKESRRTALYFNNAFWLQTILDESGYMVSETTAAEKQPTEQTPVFISSLAETETGAAEQIPVRVSSFDDLLSKYKLEESESAEGPEKDSATATGNENNSAVIQDMEEISRKPDIGSTEDAMTETAMDTGQYILEQPLTEQQKAEPEVITDNRGVEVHEEIMNEYGIFEEVLVKKHDFDMDAFDPPEEVVSLQEEHAREIPAFHNPVMENGTIVEPALIEEPDRASDEDDYDAFDRPIEDPSSEEVDDTELRENSENQHGNGKEMPGLAGRLEEQQKTALTFDPQKAESIVFAPFHMIDYFASQGIKLVLEDNPADSFGKQLKSFTDWLKVMKKLPLKTEAGRSEQQETDRIRHFAEHSVEDRDILTESMAEVLAKQGMLENAIALFQKLSLIYPPKSAYFASRIEQLKASQP